MRVGLLSTGISAPKRLALPPKLGAILTDVKKPLLHGGLSACNSGDQSRLTMCASGATMGLRGSTVNRHKLRQH